MAKTINKQALGTFEMIDIYDMGNRNDIERLIDQTSGDAQAYAVKMLEAYDAYNDAVKSFYDDVVVPTFEGASC